MGFDAGSIQAELELDKQPFVKSFTEAQTLAAKGIKVPVKYDIKGGLGPILDPTSVNWAAIDSFLARLKARMQAFGIADIMDMNVPQGQIDAQLARFKQKISNAKFADVLDINLNASEAARQWAALQAVIQGATLSVPLKLDVPILPKLPNLGQQTINVGVNAGGLASAVAQVKAIGNVATAAVGTPGSAATGGGGSGISGLALAAAAAGGWFGKLGNTLKVTGGVFGGTIGMISTWHVILDAIIEGIIALGLAAAAAALGIAAMTPTLQDIKTHLQAIQTVNSALGSQIPPLTGQFQALAQQMAPQTIEIYGGALNAISSQTGGLAKIISEVVTMFDDWTAKIDIWLGTQRGMNSLLQGGVTFLGQLGHIFGTLGMALSNLVKADPGTAHFLLDIIQGVASLIGWVTKLPTPLLMAAIGLHSLWVWGNVLGTALQVLVGWTKQWITGLVGLATNPFVWVAIAAAGLAYLGFQANQADTYTKNLISNLNQQLATDNITQAIGDINTGIGQLSGQIRTLNAGEISASWGTWGQVAHQLGFAVDQLVAGLNPTHWGLSSLKNDWAALTSLWSTTPSATQVVNADIAAMNAELQKLDGQYTNVFREAGNLIGRHFSLAQSFALMDIAGVRAGDSFQLMRQKVDNLIKGYEMMGVQGGILANSVNAVTFNTLLQQSQVAQLTGGWDAFFKMLTGGESSFLTFAQGMLTLKTDLQTAGASMTGLNAQSLTAQQQFLSNADAAQKEMDALTTLAAAAGGGATATAQLTQAAKDMIQQMLPAAQHSSILTTILYGLAQQGGYQGANSFKALSEWVGKTHDPMTNLQNDIAKMTAAAGNLTEDVKNLSTALGVTLNDAMATAIFTASGGTQTFDTFARAVLQTGAYSGTTKQAAIALGNQLITLTGNTQQAQGEFLTFAQVGLHISKQQADALWQDILHNLNPALASIPPLKVTTVKLQGQGSFQVISGGGLPQGTVGGIAAGGMITGGTPGRDSVLGMLMPGEVVVPTSMVQAGAVDHLRGALPGFAAGGFVPRYGPGPVDGLYPWWAGDYNSLLGSYEQQMETLFKKTATVSIAPGVIGGLGGGVTQWAGTALEAMRMLGISSSLLGIVLTQMQTESGGNPYAVNLWDSNAAAGMPSTGLMQVIAPTYARWGAPWFGYPAPVANMVSENPLANIFAGLNYATHTYGANWVNVLGKGHGYAAGGLVMPGDVSWFDGGGLLPEGLSIVGNASGQAEVIAPGGLGDMIDLLNEISAKLDDVTDAAAMSGHQAGAALGQMLNGMARSAVNGSLYG